MGFLFIVLYCINDNVKHNPDYYDDEVLYIQETCCNVAPNFRVSLRLISLSSNLIITKSSSVHPPNNGRSIAGNNVVHIRQLLHADISNPSAVIHFTSPIY